MTADPWQPPRRSWRKKFLSAFHGIWLGIEGQSSFLIHLAAAALVIVAAALLRVSPVQWCLLVLCIGIVLAAELFNSALEWMCRALTDRYDPRIARALDIASGAVLITSLAAATAGAIIFAGAIAAQWGEWRAP
jgi:diacylglycerol kinase